MNENGKQDHVQLEQLAARGEATHAPNVSRPAKAMTCGKPANLEGTT